MAPRRPVQQPDDFPADFFNTTVKAGAVFTTPGAGFRNDSTLFSEINPDYATQFLFFTANNVFAPSAATSSTSCSGCRPADAGPGAAASALCSATWDLADKTTIQLFAQEAPPGHLQRAGPVRRRRFSFVGVTFADAIISRVRITLGTGALGANVNDVSSGGTVDLVVLDNLIYGEPRKAS